MTRWRWLLSQFSRRLWLRVTLFALLGVGTAIAGIVLAPYVPDDWTITIGAQAIDGILNVLASSLLAVTVFSLSTMVAAYGAATENVTPRATKLMMEDNTSQNVLGTFIGAFLFSLVGIVALSTGLYGSQGRAILLVVTVCLIALIAATILRWINYLARFGQLGETIHRVETATWSAMETRLANPYLGGRPMIASSEPRPGGQEVFAGAVGYVQHVDVPALQTFAEELGAQIFVLALPGTFADPARPLAMVTKRLDDEGCDRIADAFTIAPERTFDQDPRFGLCVLAEIASRALSAAVNDQGTAIDVIGRAVRILVKWSRFQSDREQPDPVCPDVWVPAIEVDDMFDDVFGPIARDGAGILEVQLRLQKALLALAEADPQSFAAAARRHSAIALERATRGLTLEGDREAVRAVAARVASMR